jgi:[ribosomal protein S5]-alanine N-acetyltransferase
MLDLATVPVLETERLCLRLPAEADLEPLIAMLADPEVVEFLGGTPADREQSWRSLAAMIGHWVLRGYGLFSVEEKSTRQLVGRVGLLNPEGWPEPEVAWTIARPAWGKGYAGEAALAVLGWAAGPLRLPPPISLVDPANRRSARVAEKLGATVARRITFHGSEVDVWRHRPA